MQLNAGALTTHPCQSAQHGRTCGWDPNQTGGAACCVLCAVCCVACAALTRRLRTWDDGAFIRCAFSLVARLVRNVLAQAPHRIAKQADICASRGWGGMPRRQRCKQMQRLSRNWHALEQPRTSHGGACAGQHRVLLRQTKQCQGACRQAAHLARRRG